MKENSTTSLDLKGQKWFIKGGSLGFEISMMRKQNNRYSGIKNYIFLIFLINFMRIYTCIYIYTQTHIYISPIYYLYIHIYILVYSLSFDKCVYPCNCHHNQDVKHFHFPKKLISLVNLHPFLCSCYYCFIYTNTDEI